MKYLILTLSLLTTEAMAEEIRSHIVASANEVGISPELLTAVCWVESNHRNVNNWSDGNSASYGPCQIKYTTAKMLGFDGPISSLYDPKVSTLFAAKFLRKQLNRYDYHWLHAIAAYNTGRLKTNDQGQIVNKKYVTKVLQAMQEGR